MSSTVRFEAGIEQLKTTTLVRFPADASASLPSRGQVAVRGSLNGHTFLTVLEPDGRRGHWLKLGPELREVAGVGAGDGVVVEVEPTKEWPEPVIPDDLAAALTEATDLREVWAAITPMARWEWVRWVHETRNPATRAKRVEVTVSKLRSGKRRPCCFDLSACTDPELSKNGELPEAG